MDRIRWEWQGRRVMLVPADGNDPAPRVFEIRKSRSLEEVQDFQGQLDAALSVHNILRGAHHAFQAGLADYSDAADNIRQLILELPKAAKAVEAAAGRIQALFSPPGLSDVFGADLERLAAFAVDALPRMADFTPEPKTPPKSAEDALKGTAADKSRKTKPKGE